VGKYHVTVTESQRCDQCHRMVMSQSQSHDKSSMRTMGGQSITTEVKCISSVENLMGTLSSSPCQL